MMTTKQDAISILKHLFNIYELRAESHYQEALSMAIEALDKENPDTLITQKRGLLGSDIIQAIKAFDGPDPVFVAMMKEDVMVLSPAPDKCFESLGQNIWDQGVPLEEPTCRECGCTDDRACEGGCYWAGPDICSNCVPLNIELVEPGKVE